MSSSRPGPLFAVLMLASLATAVLVPPRLTWAVRRPFLGLFWPVAAPARAAAGLVDRRVRPTPIIDDAAPGEPRPAATVYAENHALRSELAALQVKFDQLSRLNADRQMVGSIRQLCVPATVTGGDSSGVRDVLKVSGIDAAAVGRPVVHGNDVVGKVQAAGLTGAVVRLVTDPGFVFTARLARYGPADAAGRVTVQYVPGVRPWVQGVGHGQMAIRSTITMAQVRELKIGIGDLVLLDDREWPPNVQGFTAGRVWAVGPQVNAPLYADVRVEPAVDLGRLGEVMVVVRD